MLMVVFVSVLAAAGVGFTIVVFVSDFAGAGGFTMVVSLLAGAAGLTVSVFCSHAVKSAAVARMQMYFFIIRIGAHSGRRLIRSNPAVWTYLR